MGGEPSGLGFWATEKRALWEQVQCDLLSMNVTGGGLLVGSGWVRPSPSLGPVVWVACASCYAVERSC